MAYLQEDSTAFTPKNYGEFKAKVALEAIRGIKTVNEIGQEFGVRPTQVGLWKKELQEQAANLFDAKRGPKPVDPSSSPERLGSANSSAQAMGQRHRATGAGE